MPTNIPENIRKKIISEVVLACLQKKPAFSLAEGGSLWYFLRKITKDQVPVNDFAWANDSRIKTVKWIKKTRPDLYENIRPWLEYKYKGIEDNG